MWQVPQWGPTNIRCQRKKLIHSSQLAPRICTPTCFIYLLLRLAWFFYPHLSWRQEKTAYFILHGATAPTWPGAPHYRGFTITPRHTTPGRNPLDEWSAQRRYSDNTRHSQETDIHASGGIYLHTPWCRVLLEKLTGLQLVKKFPAFHGTRRFITVLTSIRHLYISWASPIRSIYPHPTSWRSILMLSTHLRLGLPVFEPEILASERPQTHAVDRAATGTDDSP